MRLTLKTLISLFALCVLPLVCYSQTIDQIANQHTDIRNSASDHLTDRDMEILKEAPEKRELLNQYDISEFTNNPKWLDDALAKRKKAHHTGEEIVYVFVTRGMAFTELQDMFDQVKDYQNAVVVFRGVYEDETIAQGIAEIRKYVRELKNYYPTVQLDPTLFEEHQVFEAPTMILMKNDEVLARVKGLYSPGWLIDQHHDQKRTGDLGVYGQTTIVSEPSLIDRMKHEASRINFDKKKREAYDNYWKDKDDYALLPSSLKTTTRKLDPSFVVTRDITSPEGNIIAAAGEKINPLLLTNFNQTLYIFDATKQHEVQFVLDQVKKHSETDQYMLITTRFKEDGWTHIKDIEFTFDRAVFLLDDYFSKRFSLRSTPSVVYANDKYIFVEEHLVRRSN